MTTRIVTDINGRKYITNEPLLHPPAREWVGLTDEDISLALGFGEFTVPATRNALTAIARAIEAKLREKNT